ncbi:uncharacterized protein LOC122501335 [Leptopilina heterotoma]|uniref:uncharacterized protein LOC122501335 n=1 Tax=Leptopilina heterotoma TaxID=63436 RepID=UPI001CA8E7FD|nr:uncharacterized protein LOC122501335 [Leptopilina heterotoma]
MDLIKHETNNEIIFEKAVTEVFKRISETVNEEEFRKILTIPSTINSKSKKFSKIFTDELNRSMNGTLDDIKSKEGSLTEGFVKLSNITEGIITPINYAWRPPGDVKLHLRSHNFEKVVNECEILERQISEIQMKNEEKLKKLSESQKEIDSLQEKTTYWLNRSKSDVPYMQEIIDTLEKYISSIDELQ